jgi:hypothetical protein
MKEQNNMKTPVAFLIFNRPDTTARVFAEIRRAGPPKLLVVADGPRAGRKGEEELVETTRAIIDQVDWPCEVLKNYSDVNLGCKKRVSSGIDWIFSTVEEAIILEDDCLPDPSFFPFCEELLERYRNDVRVCQIGGVNFQFGNKVTEYSYYFSRYSHIWGWASWRRAWQGYDVEMRLWKDAGRRKELRSILKEKEIIDYWSAIFSRVYRNRIDTWDYQWSFHSMINGRLTVLPHMNLISNIGFNHDATHTTGESRFNNMERGHMEFPMKHPIDVSPNVLADRFTDVNHHMIQFNQDIFYRIINGLRRWKNAI